METRLRVMGAGVLFSEILRIKFFKKTEARAVGVGGNFQFFAVSSYPGTELGAIL